MDQTDEFAASLLIVRQAASYKHKPCNLLSSSDHGIFSASEKTFDKGTTL